MATNEGAIVDNLNRRARFYGGDDAPQIDIVTVQAALEFFERKSCQSGEPAFSIDHKTPLKLGGQNIPENFQLLTENENKAKGDQDIDYRNGRILTAEYVQNYREQKHNKKGAAREQETSKATDWSRVKTRFITGELSLRDLADAENVGESAVMRRSTKEGWIELRDNYRSKVTAEVSTILAAQAVESRVIAAGTAKAVIESWLHSVKEQASAADALNAAKLLLLIDGKPTERIAQVVEDLEDDDIIRAAEQVARRAVRQGEERYSYGSASDEDGLGAGWSD